MDSLIEVVASKGNPSVVGLDSTESLVPPQVLSSFDALGSDVGEDYNKDAFRGRLDSSDASYGTAEGNVAGTARGIAVDDAAEGTSTATDELSAAQVVSAFYMFNRAIIDAVKDIVPAVKPQIAMYEAYGSVGIDVYRLTCEYAHNQGLYVLGDVKRGDIGSTAAAYAMHLTGVNSRKDDMNGNAWHEDAVTVNPYFGTDGITPFTDAAEAADKDVFALVRTSNPSSKEIQELELANGARLYERVADLVEGWGAPYVGEYGYSRLGAVVGATHPAQGRELRARMPHTFFLVPGYGAQGGTAADVAGMFDANGGGAIVNSSRGIIGAWRKAAEYDAGMNASEALDLVGRSARKAAIAMRDDLNQARKAR